MSRTYRKMPYRYYRHPTTTGTKRGEAAAKSDIIEEDYNPSNRHHKRANPSCRDLPDNWDDIHHACVDEVPPCKRDDASRGSICKKTVYPVVKVKPSPIHGNGLFAKDFITRGTTIGRIWLWKCQFDEKETIWVDNVRYRIYNWNQHQDFRFLNHSDDNNADFFQTDNRGFKLIALKDIQTNEEILTYYGEEFDWQKWNQHWDQL